MANLTTNGTHLNAIGYNGRNDLVVVRQPAAWNSRELIVTPAESRHVSVASCGIEAYAGQQGGSAVKNDTQAMVNAVSSRLAASSWQRGAKAIYSLSTRYRSPARTNLSTSSDFMDWAPYSEFSLSVVALKFRLRHLPLGRMRAVAAYVRAYQPSMLHRRQVGDGVFMHEAAGLAGASQLSVRIVDELPATAGAVDAAGTDYFEIFGVCNNGAAPVVNGPCQTYQIYDMYNFFNGRHALESPYLPTPVYVTNVDNPAAFYHDFQLGAANTSALKSGKDAYWLLAKFRTANAFAAASGMDGLAPGVSLMIYVQRLELRLVCTGDAYNT